jgi:hypothetical protein
MEEETYQQALYLGDQIDVVPGGCFVLAQVHFAPDGAGKMRIAASVGTSPLRVKFMKPEGAA